MNTHCRINTINRLNDFQTLRLLLVGEVEVDIRHSDDDDYDQRAGHASPETRLIAGSILLSGDQSAKVTRSHGRLKQKNGRT